MNEKYKYIVWDFGGVLSNSPINNFFNYERRNGLKKGSIIKINSRNILNNAWALMEKNKITKYEFCTLFKKEAAEIGIRKIEPDDILSCLDVKINKKMYEIFNLIKKKI